MFRGEICEPNESRLAAVRPSNEYPITYWVLADFVFSWGGIDLVFLWSSSSCSGGNLPRGWDSTTNFDRIDFMGNGIFVEAR